MKIFRPEFYAPSPYDANPTEPISRHARSDDDETVPLQPVTQTPDILRPANSSDSHVDDYFMPTVPYDPNDPDLIDVTPDSRTQTIPNPDRIEFFDSTLIDAKTRREELENKDFTIDEINALNDPDNPALQQLTAARQHYDTVASRRTKLFMSRADRAQLRQEQLEARQQFITARDNYINSQLLDESDVSLLAKLTAARADYAEASVAARDGNIGSNRTNRRELEKARLAYESARATYLSEIYDAYHSSDMTDDQRGDFLIALKERENGALAGEEAQHYINVTTDESNKSWIQKFSERYNKLSRTQKIAAGVGVAAIAAVSFGAIGGLAAAGGIAGAKWSRSYLQQEAERRNIAMDERSIQERSVLYAGNQTESLEERAILRAADPGNRARIYDSFNASHLEAHSGAITREGDRISRDKRKVVGKAALMTAIPAIGGAAGGMILEHYVRPLSFGLFRENSLIDLAKDRFSDIRGSDDPTDAGPRRGEAPNTAPNTPDTVDETPKPVEVPVSERAQFLYGDYAGHSMTIDVPSGSTIWEEIGQTIHAQNPSIPFNEQERLTAHIVSELLGQQPWINPRDVAAGATFTVNIPR